MEKLHFSIDIDAPATTVFDAITDKKKYEGWSAEFNPTSTFEGGWQKGDKIYFIGTNKEGKKEGMVSKIRESIPGKQISIQHLGFLDGDKEITEGPAVEKWENAMEEYFFEEKDGKTQFKVAIDITEDFKDYMSETWPRALKKLKEIAETK